MFESLIYFFYLKIFVKSYTNIETLIISILIPIIRLNCDGKFLNSILYYQILTLNGRCAISQLIDVFFVFDIDLYMFSRDLFYLLLFNWTKVFYCAIICIFLAISMFYCYKNSNINLGRKLIHFALFLILLRIDDFIKEILEIILLLNHVLSANFSGSVLCKSFRSERDFGKILISNTLILSSSYFIMFFQTKYEDHIFTLISMMILDSATSMIGKYLECKKKSIPVTCLGILSANFTHFLIFRNNDYVIFYILIGLVENYIQINDNLVIPIVSAVLLKFFKRFL